MGILITSVLSPASDRFAISSSLSSIFGVLIFHLGHISLSWCTCYVVRGRALGIHQGGATRCYTAVLYVGEGSERELCHLLGPRPAFCHFCHYSQVNWAFLVLIPRRVVLCIFWDPVGLSNELSCEAGNFSCRRNYHRFLQPEVLRLSFPVLVPWVVRSISLPACSSQFGTALPAATLPAFAPAARLRPSYQSE